MSCLWPGVVSVTLTGNLKSSHQLIGHQRLILFVQYFLVTVVWDIDCPSSIRSLVYITYAAEQKDIHLALSNFLFVLSTPT